MAGWLKTSGGSVTTIGWSYRETGSYLPTPHPGRKLVLSAGKWEEIKKLVADTPDETLDEIIGELDLPIHKSRLSVLLIEEGYSFKKRQLIPWGKTTKRFKKRGRIYRNHKNPCRLEAGFA